jgi:peptidoglycan/LPS O-acetylase OafA/YrhL
VDLNKPTPLTGSPKHIRSLDGLRGVAALGVVTFHFMPHAGLAFLSPLISIGWSGVDAFLVLSGYLITGILYKQRGAPHFFRNFYIRRALRLFPLYYFILFLAFVTSIFVGAPWRRGHVAFLFYGANIALIFHQSLGDLGIYNLRHIWTLALEEQFYFVWPWIVGGVGGRLPRKALLWCCASGIVLAIFLRLLLVDHTPAWTLYYSLPMRMDSLLIGATLALVPLPSKRVAIATLLAALAALGGVVAAAHSLFFTVVPMMLFGYSILAIFYGALLVLALHPETVIAKALSTRPMRFLGKLSYGLYLWHYLFITQAEALAARVARAVHPAAIASLLTFAITAGTSLLIAYLRYLLLESPFLRLKDRFEVKQMRSGPSPIDA